MEKRISNWKDYLVDGVDVKSLEENLANNGWLHNGDLILKTEAENYSDRFWNIYQIVFHKEILGG